MQIGYTGVMNTYENGEMSQSEGVVEERELRNDSVLTGEQINTIDQIIGEGGLDEGEKPFSWKDPFRDKSDQFGHV